jgi:hypothetical protein
LLLYDLGSGESRIVDRARLSKNGGFNMGHKGLSYANVMSTVAVFIALGGSAYAAVKLPPNSVGTKQLKAGAVTAPKVAKHSLTGAQIRSSTLGIVPTASNAHTATNALNLGGQPGSAFQSRIGGTCSGSGAVAAIAANGSVTCHVPATPVFSRVDNIASGNTDYGEASGELNGDLSGQALANAGQVTPVALTGGNLSVIANHSNVTVTMFVNGTASALTCTTGAGGSCTDTTHTVAVPAGAVIEFQVKNNSGTSIAALIGWEAT